MEPGRPGQGAGAPDAFSQWFGQSKARLPDGSPLLLFHGTPNASFTAFSPELLGSNTATRDAKAGYYFTDDEDFAWHFTEKRAHDSITGQRVTMSGTGRAGVMRVHLSLQKPMDLRRLTPSSVEAILKTGAMGKFATADQITQLGRSAKGCKELQLNLAHCVPELRELGYDGIISRLIHKRKVRTEFIAFEPTQIKSATHNTGAFAKMNPDIRFSLGDHLQQAAPAQDEVARVTRAVAAVIGTSAMEKLAKGQGGVRILHSSEIGSIAGLTIAHEARASHSDPRRVFFSALSRAIESATFERAPAAAWREFILAQTRKGVKGEEIEWSGVVDWLGTQSGRIEKADVLAFSRRNGLELHQVTLDDPNAAVESLIKAMNGTGYTAEYDPLVGEMIYIDADEEMLDYVDLPAHVQAIVDGFSSAANGNVEYGTKTMPGGSNYREILLALPRENAYSIAERVAEGDLVWAIVDSSGQTVSGTSCFAMKKMALEEARSMNREQATGTYLSGHWSQPNVLVHVRVADYIDADNKRVLFVEEIQSDWGQAAKQVGIMGPALTPAEYREFNDLVGQVGSLTPDKLHRLDALKEKNARSSIGVPAAPFIKTTDGWLNLALKQVLAMAVTQGYDRVAFINGEQSSARYDLGKKLKKVTAIKVKDGFHIYGMDLLDNTIDYGAHAPEKLAGVVGKELADKIAAQTYPNDVYQCGEKRVGGSGMEAFYDHMVPGAMKALLRKVAGEGLCTVKFQEHSDARERLGTDYALKELDSQVGFDITPAITSSVLSGLPLFSRSLAGAQALYAPSSDTMYLIADRIAHGHERAVFLHETMHAKGPAIVGSRAMQRMSGQVSAWESRAEGTMERKIHDRATERASDALGAGHPHYTEELLAYAVEEAVLLGVKPSIEAADGSAENWLADVTATIQGAIFQATQGTVLDLSAQELVDLAYALAQMENPDRAEQIRDALRCAPAAHPPTMQERLTG